MLIQISQHGIVTCSLLLAAFPCFVNVVHSCQEGHHLCHAWHIQSVRPLNSVTQNHWWNCSCHRPRQTCKRYNYGTLYGSTIDVLSNHYQTELNSFWEHSLANYLLSAFYVHPWSLTRWRKCWDLWLTYQTSTSNPLGKYCSLSVFFGIWLDQWHVVHSFHILYMFFS